MTCKPSLIARIKYALVEPFRREDGSITTEAVIIMPLLAAFYCVTFVWFDAFRQKTLIMKASYAVSDVLSRQSQVDEPFMDNMRDVLDYMIPSNARPKMRISLIEYNPRGAGAGQPYRLRWSYGPDGMGDLTQEDIDRDTSWLPLMADLDAVVVTETAVLYQPLFRVGIGDQVYRNTFVTRPRFDLSLLKSDEPPYTSNLDDRDAEGDGEELGEAPDDGGDDGDGSDDDDDGPDLSG